MSALARILEEFGSQPSPPAARQAAAQALREHSLPTRQDENWHYANLRALENVAGFLPRTAPEAVLTPASLPSALPGFERLVYVDGRLHPELSAAALTKLERVAAGHDTGR